EDTGAATDASAAGDGGEEAKSDDGGDEAKSDGGDAAKSDDPYAIAVRTECPADVNQDMPTSVFNDAVLIRLPKGVEAFVEQNPFFATINPSKPESTSCVEGVPGATILNGAMGYFQDDPEMDMEQYLKDTVEGYGYPLDTTKIEMGPAKGKGSKRSITADLDVPAGNGAPAARAHVMIKGGHGRMHWLIYECEAPAWNALKATFKESAKTMILLNPDAG
ncbi:MAG: hypothetical protein ACPHRO_13660, partial [Nannocystaceae bacterium]